MSEYKEANLNQEIKQLQNRKQAIAIGLAMDKSFGKNQKSLK